MAALSRQEFNQQYKDLTNQGATRDEAINYLVNTTPTSYYNASSPNGMGQSAYNNSTSTSTPDYSAAEANAKQDYESKKNKWENLTKSKKAVHSAAEWKAIDQQIQTAKADMDAAEQAYKAAQSQRSSAELENKNWLVRNATKVGKAIGSGLADAAAGTLNAINYAGKLGTDTISKASTLMSDNELDVKDWMQNNASRFNSAHKLSDTEWNSLSDNEKKMFQDQYGINSVSQFNTTLASADRKDYLRQSSLQSNAETQKAIASDIKPISETRDRLAQESVYGTSGLGKFALELVPSAVGMAFDAAVNTLTGGAGLAAMGTRIFGNSYQDAIDKGASNERATAYGLAHAAIEVLTEMIGGDAATNALAYGNKGLLNSGVENIIAKIPSRALRGLALTGAGMAEEAIEEVAAEFLNPFAEAILDSNYGKAVKQKLGEQKAMDYVKAAAGGALLAFAGAPVGAITGNTTARLNNIEINHGIETDSGLMQQYKADIASGMSEQEARARAAEVYNPNKNIQNANVAIREELQHLSMLTPEMQAHAVEAYRQNQQQLATSKTGDVLVGDVVREDGTVEHNHKFGTVVNHNKSGIILQLEGSNETVVIPDGFLNSQAVESVFSRNGEIISSTEYTDRTQETAEAKKQEEAYKNMPFTVGEEPAQQPTSADYRSNSSIQEEIDNLNTKSTEELKTELEELGERGKNMSEKQTTLLKDAIQKELESRSENAIIEENAEGGQASEPVQPNSDVERYRDGQQGQTDISGRGNSEDQRNAGEGQGVNPVESSGNPETDKLGSDNRGGTGRGVPRRVAGREIRTETGQDGKEYSVIDFGDGKGVKVLNETRDGKPAIISDDELTESQRKNIDKYKSFGFAGVILTRNNIDNGRRGSLGRVIVTENGETYLALNVRTNPAVRSLEMITKHEMTHMYSRAAERASNGKRNSSKSDIVKSVREVVGKDNYNAARDAIAKTYFPNIFGDDVANGKSFNSIYKNLPSDAKQNVKRTIDEEMLAQLMSDDTCYDAWDSGMLEAALKNDVILDYIRSGIDSLNFSEDVRNELEKFYGVSLTKTASESPKSAVGSKPSNNTTNKSGASTGQSERLNQPSSASESNETTQEEEPEPKKKARQSFGEHYDAAVKSNERLSRLHTIAERAVSKDATKLEKRRAEQFKKGMTTLKDNLNKVVSGEMTPEEFADYYLGLNRSSDGMATYYDSKTAERWINVQEAWNTVKESADANNVAKYRGELHKAVSQMVRSVERIDKAQRTLESLSETASKYGFDTKKKNMFSKIAKAYARWQINPSNVFRAIDGFDRNARGEGYRIQQRIDDAVADYQTLNVQAQMNLAKVKQMGGYNAFASGKKMTGVKLGGTELNMLQALSYIKAVDTMRATSPNKVFGLSGFAIDLGNGKYEFVKNTDVNVDKVYDACKAALDDVAEQYKKSADEVFEALGKRVMNTAEAIDGSTPYVFEKGKYYPLWYKSSSDDGRSWSINHSIDGNLQEKRFTHERSDDNPGFLVIQPITKVVDDYITQATNYAAFGELGSDLQLMNREENINGSISQMMAKNFGEEFAGWMQNYIDDLNEVKETDTEGINSFFKGMRNRLAQGALFLSPSVQMKQVASYWDAAGVVRMDALARAWRFKELPMKGKGKSNPLLQYRRLGNVEPTISEALDSGWIGKLSEKSELFKQLSNMTNIKDVRTVDNVYSACVLDTALNYPGMDKNSETFQKLVEQKFQEAVMNTQPIFTKQARAEYARTDNEVVRMLSMFRTQQTQNFNRLVTAIGEYNAERRNGKVSSSTALALAQTISGQVAGAASLSALSIAADLLLHRRKKYSDDEGNLDESKILERLGINAIEAAAGTAWFGDSLAKWIIDKVSKGETNEFYGISIGPVSTAMDVLESIEYLVEKPSLSNLRYTVGYIGSMTGMPINNIYAMINSVAMYAKDLSGDNGDHFDDILKWTDNERRPENQLVKAYQKGDISKANDLYESIYNKAVLEAEAKGKSAAKAKSEVKSTIKSEIKDKIQKDRIDHDVAVNLLMHYGDYDDKADAEKEIKIYELLRDEDINYNTIGESYRDGDITADQVIAARINIAGDTEEEAEQYLAKQDFQNKFGFSYTDMKDKYRAGKINAQQAIEWRMKAGGVTRESAEEWVQAQDVYLATGYEYTSTGTASYYDSYATKETIGSNTFYERHIDEFPSKKAFGDVFNDLDTNSKNKTYPTLTNRYGELGSKQTRVIYTLRDHIAKGDISTGLAKEIWEEYYGYSTYNWHFVTD